MMTERDVQPEIMDQPGLDATLHRAALRGLATINAWSGTARNLWPRIRQQAEQGACRVLDLASGGGDVACDIARRALRKGLPIDVYGCDISSLAVATAQERATRLGLGNVHFFVHDVLRQGVPEGFDVVTCTLFLHHLSPEQARQLLHSAARSAARLVLVDDLRRTRIGYALAVTASRILTRSPVVRVDGPLSVRAAFTETELAELARSAGLMGFSIRRHWPQRMLLICRTRVDSAEAAVHGR